MTVPQTTILRHKLWHYLNPLRRWRKEHTFSRALTGEMLGASAQSVDVWERGNVWPTDANMARIGNLLGMTLPEVEALWSAWYRLLHPTGKQRRHNTRYVVASAIREPKQYAESKNKRVVRQEAGR